MTSHPGEVCEAVITHSSLVLLSIIVRIRDVVVVEVKLHHGGTSLSIFHIVVDVVRRLAAVAVVVCSTLLTDTAAAAAAVVASMMSVTANNNLVGRISRRDDAKWHHGRGGTT